LEDAAESGGGGAASRSVRQLDSMVDTIMDPNQSLNPEQQHQLDQIEVESQDRMKEIVKVAQSINELASLFRELNVLVIEQGTILDRIDYNVEQTVERVKHGVVDLDAADKISKKAITAKCIGALIIAVAILLLALIIKWSAQASTS
jgi:syntaxin 16